MLLLSYLLPLKKSIDYARSKSRATIVNELGPEALFDPAIMASERGKPAGGPGKVTISSAQAEARGKDNKRTREDATGEEEDEEDEDEDGERDGKRRTKQQSDEDDEGECISPGDVARRWRATFGDVQKAPGSGSFPLCLRMETRIHFWEQMCVAKMSRTAPQTTEAP